MTEKLCSNCNLKEQLLALHELVDGLEARLVEATEYALTAEEAKPLIYVLEDSGYFDGHSGLAKLKAQAEVK